MPDEMKLTDTQLLDLIEKHTLEVAFRLSDQGWRVWIADIPAVKAPTLRAALHLAHTIVVTRLLHPKI